MKHRELWIVFSSQEFDSANHIHFWKELSKKIEGFADLLIINILADQLITRIKGKTYRINEHKEGLKNIERNLFLYRPLTLVRPEILPKRLQAFSMRTIRRQLKNAIQNFDERPKVTLYYDCKWNKSLHLLDEEMTRVYYIYDEVYLNASTGKEIRGMRQEDYESCVDADLILTMTKDIAQRRDHFKDKIIVFGNGSLYEEKPIYKQDYKNNTIGFVGNFRDWIDFDLLVSLIEKRNDCFFYFAGPIQENVSDKFNEIINGFTNTAYLGNLPKNKVSYIYQMLDIVIVPYKDNEHIKSTRPIKIVESLFNHTPVITIPMNGYKQNQYIRIANSATDFSRQIDFLMGNKPDFENDEFLEFIRENKWDSKAEMLVNEIKLKKQEKS